MNKSKRYENRRRSKKTKETDVLHTLNGKTLRVEQEKDICELTESNYNIEVVP